MTTCRLCFQAVTQGVPVPGCQQASGMVHEECVAAAALKAAQANGENVENSWRITGEKRRIPHAHIENILRKFSTSDREEFSQNPLM